MSRHLQPTEIEKGIFTGIALRGHMNNLSEIVLCCKGLSLINKDSSKPWSNIKKCSMVLLSSNMKMMPYLKCPKLGTFYDIISVKTAVFKP